MSRAEDEAAAYDVLISTAASRRPCGVLQVVLASPPRAHRKPQSPPLSPYQKSGDFRSQSRKEPTS